MGDWMEQNSSETDNYSASQEMYPAFQKNTIFSVVKSIHFNSVWKV
jgi:hypothetical protein